MNEPLGSKAPPVFRAARGEGRWEEVEILTYKAEDSAPFKDITRQVLFAAPELGCELRYFEIAPGGHSTLERHEHVHAVMILHGKGRCMVGDAVRELSAHELVSIPPLTWHQFRAAPDAPLGFLCMVNRERDKPRLPTDEEFEALRRIPAIAALLAGG
jgi:quercetin dioxygenase-like cupin family protein